MVMKSFTKSILRDFKANIVKMISLALIIFLGVCFVTGLGSLSSVIKNSYSNYLKNTNYIDLTIMKNNSSSFTQKEKIFFSKNKDVETYSELRMFELQDNNLIDRIYIQNSDDFNKFYTLVEGSFPILENQVAIDRISSKNVKIGDKIKINIKNNILEKEVVGIISNPLYFSKEDEPSFLNSNIALNHIYYLNDKAFDSFGSTFSNLMLYLIPINTMFIHIVNSSSYTFFNSSYEDFISEKIKDLQKNDFDLTYITFNENKSYQLIENYTNKIDVIVLVFPLFFALVTALVVMTSMSNMVENDRKIIGCYKTLGYSDSIILSKYIFFVLAISIIFIILGLVIGLYLLPGVIYPAFDGNFYNPKISLMFNPILGLIFSLALIVIVVLQTIYLVKKSLKEEPACLLNAKAPKVGKKILLEKIPFIWKHLSFKFKSMFRNIFRNKKHLVLTIISVAGSTVLVFAGFALIDEGKVMETSRYKGISSAISQIALVVIIFGLLLAALVIYNLTNMNISERKREIATLKVLGYQDYEVVLYIYRELLVLVTVGILFGIPLGLLLIYFVFSYLEFGSIKDIKIQTYFISVFCIFTFIILSDFLLVRKILKISMTSSLKSND